MLSIGKQDSTVEIKSITIIMSSSNANNNLYEGGCLCRKIRYRATGIVSNACHCHCTTCRKSSGAAVVQWVTFQLSSFAWINNNKPTFFSSTPNVQRGFCSNCGTTLSYQINPNEIDITLSTLDNVNSIVPEYHVWIEDKVSWTKVSDNLPQFQKES
jgi:hypothetical protein